MLPDISTLIAMKYGITSNIMISRNLVMIRMEHGVRTKHGDSKSTHRQETGDTELAGKSQDKADVACIWSQLSQTIFRANQILHKGINLPSANGKRQIIRNNDTFVDDCDEVAAKRRKTFSKSEQATRKHLLQHRA